MGCRCLCLCCRCCCRGCISKWCDQINDRLAPKALKKFSSCFLFFVFHSRIDSAPLFSQEIFLARTAAAAAVTIETVSVASQRAAGPGDGPQTDSQTVYLSKYLSIVCGVKKVHILLGRERKKKIRALNANTCGVELSFFLQPQVACGALLPINLCPAIKNYKSARAKAFPLYREEVGKVQLRFGRRLISFCGAPNWHSPTRSVVLGPFNDSLCCVA